jgi:hypothetical protein
MTTSPKTCTSPVSSNSDDANSGLHQSPRNASCLAARERASASLSAATTARNLVAFKRYSRCVSRTESGCEAGNSAVTSTAADAPAGRPGNSSTNWSSFSGVRLIEEIWSFTGVFHALVSGTVPAEERFSEEIFRGLTRGPAFAFCRPKPQSGGPALSTRIRLGDDGGRTRLSHLAVAIAAIPVRRIRRQEKGRVIRLPLRLRLEDASGS